MSSEIRLILTAGFSVIAIVLFFFGDRTFLPVAERLDARPTVVWLTMSFLLASLWATAHFLNSNDKIRKARDLNTALLCDYEIERLRQ